MKNEMTMVMLFQVLAMLVTVYLERSKTTDEREFPTRLFCINIEGRGGVWYFLYMQHNLHIFHI